MLIHAHYPEAEVAFRKALGLKSSYQSWSKPELPNETPSNESEFWNFRRSQGFSVETHNFTVQGTTIPEGYYPPDLMIYFAGRNGGHEIFNGGFGVYIHTSKKWQQPSFIRYVKWTPCVHEWKSRNIGNCLNEYTCVKCNDGYSVDSSG